MLRNRDDSARKYSYVVPIVMAQRFRAAEVACALGIKDEPHGVRAENVVLRLAAKHGMAFVTSADVERARYMRRKSGPVSNVAFAETTENAARCLQYGRIGCVFAAAIEHGLRLLAHEPAPARAPLQSAPPWAT